MPLTFPAPSRRTALRTAAGVAGTALAGGLTGCAVGDSIGPDTLSKGPVTLRMTWWGGDARHQSTFKAIKLFEKLNPRITVKAEFADWTGYWDRLATSAAGGNSADVIQMDAAYLASYAERGGLFDLGKSKHFDPSVYAEDSLDMGRYKNGLYAAPISVTAMGLMVNTSLLERLDLRLPDTRSWTWKDMESFALEITEASGGKTHGGIPLAGPGMLNLWARQHRQELFGPDGTVDMSPELAGELWGQARDWVRNGASPAAGIVVDGMVLPLDQSPLATKKTAMMGAWCSQLIAHSEAAGDDTITLADWPVDPDAPRRSQFVKPGMYWSVSSQSQHPAEAAQLINFLVADERCAKIMGVERGIPAVTPLREAIKPSLAKEDAAALAFVERLEEGLVGKPLPISPNGASDVELIQNRYSQEVLFGRVSSDEAGAGFIEEISNQIKSVA